MSRMRLNKYDGKCVRITDRRGDVFEGVAEHDSADYCFHEYGRDEDGIELGCFLFYRSDIKKIEVLQDRGGPWGCFSAPYGLLEEMICDDGPDLIDEIFSDEDDVHTERLLRCLAVRLAPGSEKGVPGREQLPALLRSLLKLTDSDEVRGMAQALLETVDSEQNRP